MSIEALWYKSYSNGEPPRAKRISRMDMQQQWALTIDLAMCFACDEAGYTAVRSIWKTGEIYWYWPHILSDSNWWLVPERICKRVARLTENAQTQAMRERHRDATRVLTRWEKTGAWRRHCWHISPRSSPERAEIIVRDEEDVSKPLIIGGYVRQPFKETINLALVRYGQGKRAIYGLRHLAGEKIISESFFPRSSAA